MAQRTTTSPATEIEHSAIEHSADETAELCCHHWVISPAEGPVSNGSCKVCGETREFKNYVESATWGDSRTTGKGSSASATSESTSDDEEMANPVMEEGGAEPDMERDDSELESEN
ncbi:MAG: hypothetical protein BZY87_09900 [SAR202 cluster bacterium Io17-Chloro-G6]|nr:MAG: hypothetical protein BZY87_09900 [SAR202 cluster bacterium Io17-Chloro-G6]